MDRKNTYSKIGAVLYVLWGVLHVFAAFTLYRLSESLDYGIVSGRLQQSAWNMLIFAVFAIVVAVKYNWNNTFLGYWLNLFVISAVDIGFVVIILIQGHLPVFPGIIGPLVWLSAAIFSTIGVFSIEPIRKNM